MQIHLTLLTSSSFQNDVEERNIITCYKCNPINITCYIYVIYIYM